MSVIGPDERPLNPGVGRDFRKPKGNPPRGKPRPLCPRGHRVAAEKSIPCKQCNAHVIYEPAAVALDLRRQLAGAVAKLEQLLDTYYREGNWPSTVSQQESVRHLVLEALYRLEGR